jgi:AAA+ ATPase superfamily predicted ATPase
MVSNFVNPFRPGAGHMPPYLAGRQQETEEFHKLLQQTTILQNVVLTGLRGVGKTVLLDTWKSLAFQNGWCWVGTDLSESASLTEQRLALRLMTDLAVVTSSIVLETAEISSVGFRSEIQQVHRTLDFDFMIQLFNATPGLVADKLKTVLELAWQCLKRENKRGIVFAYDEAQNLSDHAQKDEYPLSLLLDVFQSIQKKDISFILVLTGLPTLFPKLVEARTSAERMFHIIFLDRLNENESKDAIEKPLEENKCTFLHEWWVKKIIDGSGGYPYFIQFIAREFVDIYIQFIEDQTSEAGQKPVNIIFDEIIRKLDSDFFSGRWARATDRQREMLIVIANLDTSESEFTVQEIAAKSKAMSERPFTPSHISQLLVSLCNVGLVYKNRHGKYSFAVPLLGHFILRQK